jgi:hypothetical protein
MIRAALLTVFCLCLVSGCGGGLAPDSNPEDARTALEAALQAWKNGESPKDLESHNPALVMNDPDWRAGKTLLQYRMQSTGTMFGRQVRWEVQIKVKDRSGKTTERKANYIIDTIPRLVIVRDIFS